MDLLQWGCPDPAQLTWLNPPPAVNLTAARSLLTQLGALEGERLTARGQKMAALGNDPRLAAMLVAAQGNDEIATAARLAAILRSRRAVALAIWDRHFRVIRGTGSSGAAAGQTPE